MAGHRNKVLIVMKLLVMHVVCSATIRTVLGLAMARQWSIHQLNVKNAFLHGDLQEQYLCINLQVLWQTISSLCLSSAQGFVWPSTSTRCLVSAFCWFFFLQIGFVIVKSDAWLFTYKQGHDIAYPLLYIDNIILCTSSYSLWDRSD